MVAPDRVNLMFSIRENVSASWTHLAAGQAANALAFIKAQFALVFYPLRIVAPVTVQVAAFEENHGTNTRPIRRGEALDIKNQRLPAALPRREKFSFIKTFSRQERRI